MSQQDPIIPTSPPLRPWTMAATSLACSVVMVLAIAASAVTDSPFFAPGVWWVLLLWLPIATVATAVAAVRRYRRWHGPRPLRDRVLVWACGAAAALYGAFAVAFFAAEIIGHG